MRWPLKRRSAREPEVYVDDPRFDGWEVVRDFEDLQTGRAFRQQLEDAGFDAVLTADWPLDRFGRGDIALRVPADTWGDAEMILSGFD